MAEAILRAESAHHNTPNPFVDFDRDTIASAVEVLIAVLDAIDGDPDAENFDPDLEEDDPSGVHDEDGINTSDPMMHRMPSGPGCPLSDSGAADTGGLYNHTVIPRYGDDQTKGPLDPWAT
ncbi:hypothetical protein WJT74_07700 [Sphingomicrobium sp. XHP0239]|uniref:hypothetical protein n=1 Tax=Sphingomicrobium maritimum TaxID=3133972 RepID=UPI0031CC3E28